jgi:hypothetical protein
VGPLFLGLLCPNSFGSDLTVWNNPFAFCEWFWLDLDPIHGMVPRIVSGVCRFLLMEHGAFQISNASFLSECQCSVSYMIQCNGFLLQSSDNGVLNVSFLK